MVAWLGLAAFAHDRGGAALARGGRGRCPRR